MAEKKESYSEEELNEMIVWFNNVPCKFTHLIFM